jgi:nitrogen regulatory protein PII
MQAIKKVEIIIEHRELADLLAVLKIEALAAGYTVIKEAYGAGERGNMAGDGLSGAFTNSYLLIACSEDEANRIVEIVRPILKRYGGVCLVSDAMWVKHK